jgi:hypothetical protein
VNVGGLVSAAGAASPAIYAESSGRGGAGSAGSVVNVTLAVGGKVSSGTDFNAGSGSGSGAGAGEQHLLALVGLSGPDLGRGGHIRSALDHVPRSREVRRAHHEIADREVLPGLRMIGHRRDGD